VATVRNGHQETLRQLIILLAVTHRF